MSEYAYVEPTEDNPDSITIFDSDDNPVAHPDDILDYFQNYYGKCEKEIEIHPQLHDYTEEYAIYYDEFWNVFYTVPVAKFDKMNGPNVVGKGLETVKVDTVELYIGHPDDGPKHEEPFEFEHSTESHVIDNDYWER